jgi:hypothetical protein
MATKKVHVFENDGEYRVHPPTVELDGSGGNTDDLDIVNHTGEELLFYFGPGLFDNGAHSATIPKNGNKKTNKAKSQGSKGKAATYKIFGVDSGKKAKGNSDPVIIIEN